MANDRAQVRIVGISGSFKGNEFFVNKDEFMIGRSTSCDLILNEKTVSGNHAKIVRVDDKFEIHDLGSTNSTFVNGEKVESKELRTNDTIKFDIYEFRFINPMDVAKTQVSSTHPSEAQAIAATPTPVPKSRGGGRAADFKPRGHLFIGLFTGLLIAYAVLIGGFILTSFIDSNYGFDVMLVVKGIFTTLPLLHTHMLWINPVMGWTASAVITLVIIILAPFIGGLLTRLIGKKNIFVSALMFSLLYAGIFILGQLVVLEFNFQILESSSSGLFGIYNGMLSTLVLFAYAWGVTFMLSFIGALFGRK